MDILQNLDKFSGDFEKRARRSIDNWAIKTQRTVQEKIIQNSGVSTGVLKNSIESETLPSAVGFKSLVFTDLDYAQFYEFGRKPGKMPPVDDIEEWVKRKVAGGMTLDEGQTTRSIAFAIARSIAKNGTKGRFVFTETFEERKRVFAQEVIAGMMKV